MAFGNTYCNQLGSDASTFFCLFMLSIVYCLSFIVLLQIKEIPEGFSLLLLLPLLLLVKIGKLFK